MLFKAETRTQLDRAIDAATQTLDMHDASSDEYGVILDRISAMHKIRENQNSRRVSPDTLAMIAANLIGIAMIIRHENVNVITSKAMGFVQKPK